MGGETEENVPKPSTEEWEVYESKGDISKQTEPARSKGFSWVSKKENRERDEIEPKFEGFRKSKEYWARVWREGHNEGSKGPWYAGDTKVKEKWESLRKEGKTDVEILEILTKENPRHRLWSTFMNRTGEKDEEKSHEDMRKRIFHNIKEHHFEIMTSEQRDKFEKMKSENKENEFWKDYWKELNKEGHSNRRRMGFWYHRGHCREQGRPGSNPTDQTGVQTEGERQIYRKGFRHWGWTRCGRKEKSDDKSFYKEFDFVN